MALPERQAVLCFLEEQDPVFHAVGNTECIAGYRFPSTSNKATLELLLRPQRKLYATPGAMVYKGADIELKLSTPGGLFKALKRTLTGEQAILPSFVNTGTSIQPVAFTKEYPGEAAIFDLSRIETHTLIAQNHTFLCATDDTTIDVAMHKKLSVAVLGHDGFFLQRFSSPTGYVALYVGGSLIPIYLTGDQQLDVDIASVLAFTPTITYSIRSVGNLERGFLGGEGLWLCSLKGPGHIYLQTHPPWRLTAGLLQSAGLEDALKSKTR